MREIEKKLLEKSIEAFVLGIEIYNKPTIKYRVEGFSLFICNAWELMLKSYLIKTQGETSIYYKDKRERTITLENCIKKIITNSKDPLRINLEKIIELRNTSTHFITTEYEMLYIPLFQACVFNFDEKIKQFHNINISKYIPQNFLTLSVNMKALDDSVIIAKYPEEIVNKLLKLKENIDDLSNENNAKFSIRIDHHHYLTKDINKATSIVKVDNSSERGVKIIKEIKDPSKTHSYNAKKCIQLITEKLKKESIEFQTPDGKNTFNKYYFSLFINYYELKKNEKYCYIYKVSKSPVYSYSYQTIEFIVDEIVKDSENIIKNIKKNLANKKS